MAWFLKYFNEFLTQDLPPGESIWDLVTTNYLLFQSDQLSYSELLLSWFRQNIWISWGSQLIHSRKAHRKVKMFNSHCVAQMCSILPFWNVFLYSIASTCLSETKIFLLITQIKLNSALLCTLQFLGSPSFSLVNDLHMN